MVGVRCPVPVRTAFSIRPFLCVSEDLPCGQTSAGQGKFLAAIFENDSEISSARFGSSSRPRLVFMASEEAGRRAKPVCRFNFGISVCCQASLPPSGFSNPLM